MKKLLLFLSGLIWGCSYGQLPVISWDSLPHLPPINDQEIQHGLAGAYLGFHGDVIILAGGANFPNGPAWEGGEKAYHKDIYVLKKKGGSYEWISPATVQLRDAWAYGLGISTEQGLLCLGGMNQHKVSADAFWLKWISETQTVRIDSFIDLPVPLANMSGGLIGNTVYVAGVGQHGDKYFLSMNLVEGKTWEQLPSWPGSPRTHAYGTVQNNGEEDCFYLLKGRWTGENGISEFFSNGFVYQPSKKIWKEIGGGHDKPLSAGTSLPIGANHILLLGGDDGKRFGLLEKLNNSIRYASGETRDSLQGLRDSLMKHHPGFSQYIWAFHTITDTWIPMGMLPEHAPVTTPALIFDEQIMLLSGEISPCIRTDKNWRATIVQQSHFSRLNTSIVILYLLFLAGLGLYFSKRQSSTEDFFKAGKRIPAWAAGLSIFGTQLSAITFMAIPAKTYATDWLYFFLNMTIIMVAPFIIRIFLPFYRKFNLTSAYEYLEYRFNLATRLIGSSMYIILQLGRLGIVLLLPSLALSLVTGYEVGFCILSMGLLSILYTVLGGIEAVIWTDVMQVFVLLGGALLCLVLLFIDLDPEYIVETIQSYDKVRILDLNVDFTEATFWVVIFGGLATNLIQYGSDQTVIQRYLTTETEQAAANSIRIGAWLALPATLIFFTLGTLLFVFYKAHPELLNPALPKTDGIFPWYIVQQLPEGVSGLLVAGIFAASMSSLDSSMNSVSTVLTTDFVRRLFPFKRESSYLPFARRATLVVGVIGTGLALLMASWGITSLWDQFNLIIGFFAGGLGGIFLLGMLSQKATGKGALLGLVISGGIQYYIKSFTDIHFLLYAFTGMLSAIILGYLFSLVLGKNSEEQLRYVRGGGR